MVTTRVVNKGDLVISAKPFAFALFQSERDNRCDQCFKTLGTKIPCYKCFKVAFCSRKCQTDSNAEGLHAHECPVLRERPLSCLTRLMARIIKKLEDKENEHAEMIDGHRRDWKCLMDHYDDITRDATAMYEFEKLHDQLCLIFGDSLPDIRTVISTYGKLLINSFAVQDELMRQIGRAVYLGPSIFDHSCRPSLNFMFIGTMLYIKAIKTVEISDITDLRICYIDEFETTEERRRELSAQYYFECDCERCTLNDDKSVVTTDERKDLRPICEKIESLTHDNHHLVGSSCGQRRRLTESRMENDKNLIAELVAQLKKDVMPLDNVLEVRIADFVATHTLDIDLWLRVIDIYRSYYGDCHQRLALKLFILALNCRQYPALKRQLLSEAKTIAKHITPESYVIDDNNRCRSRCRQTVRQSSDCEQTLAHRIQSELIDANYLKQYVTDNSRNGRYSASLAATHYKQRSRSQYADSSYRTRTVLSNYSVNHRSPSNFRKFR